MSYIQKLFDLLKKSHIILKPYIPLNIPNFFYINNIKIIYLYPKIKLKIIPTIIFSLIIYSSKLLFSKSLPSKASTLDNKNVKTIFCSISFFFSLFFKLFIRNNVNLSGVYFFNLF